MAKHIDVTSQLTRHQMLMDLAKSVKDHVDANPDQTYGPYEADDVQETQKYHHSSR